MEDAFSVPFILSWLKSYVARFTTHIQICLATNLLHDRFERMC